jgi:hypothetical protein
MATQVIYWSILLLIAIVVYQFQKRNLFDKWLNKWQISESHKFDTDFDVIKALIKLLKICSLIAGIFALIGYIFRNQVSHIILILLFMPAALLIYISLGIFFGFMIYWFMKLIKNIMK